MTAEGFQRATGKPFGGVMGQSPMFLSAKNQFMEKFLIWAMEEI